MISLLLSPFFLLFCATSGLAAYLGQRICIRRIPPSIADRAIAIGAALLSVALSVTTYCMRLGLYTPPRIDPSTASVIAAATGMGVAFVCLRIVLQESTE